jgi:quercetin dioxygenase-like cupin family protein
MENIFKVWGERRRQLLTNQIELDLLYIKKDHFCSTHHHTKKINLFSIVSGKVKIQTEYGDVILTKNEQFTILPPMVHRFYALEDTTMIEVAYVNDGVIDENDINRKSQGGKIINGKEYTLEELKTNNLLNL